MKNHKSSIITKLLLALSLIVITAFAGTVYAEETYDLHIKLTNVLPGQGKIVVSIYNTKDTWLKAGKEYKIVKKSVDNTSNLTVTVTGLKTGKYGLIVYQDENSNNDFDRNFLNIPKERYALSNNKKPMFKPSFDDCLFNINKEMTLNLNLID